MYALSAEDFFPSQETCSTKKTHLNINKGRERGKNKKENKSERKKKLIKIPIRCSL